MNKRTKSRSAAKGVGAAVVIAFLIGMYTGIPGFGGGAGTGPGAGAKGNADVNPASATATGGGPVEAPEKLTETGLEDNVLTVLIDAHQYSVLIKRDGQEEFKIVDIENVVALARQAKGDQNTGVRVKVLLQEHARISAEEQLRDALAKAGVQTASVYWVDQIER